MKITAEGFAQKELEMQLWKSESQKSDKKIGGYWVHKARRPKSAQDSSETVGVWILRSFLTSSFRCSSRYPLHELGFSNIWCIKYLLCLLDFFRGTKPCPIRWCSNGFCINNSDTHRNFATWKLITYYGPKLAAITSQEQIIERKN